MGTATTTFERTLRHFSETDNGPRAVMNLLQNLQMHVPEDGQFLEANQGALIAHPSAGVVLRIERDKTAFNHALVAPVIGAFTAGGFLIELVAGGRTNDLGAKECMWVNDRLHKTGVYWRDSKPEDLMRLPLTTKEHPKGLPVIMDREYIYETPLHMFTHSVKAVSAKMFGLKVHEPELEDFGVSTYAANNWRRMINGLSTQLESALDNKSGQFDQAKVSSFWRMAEDATFTHYNKDAAFLYRGWDETDTSQPKEQNPWLEGMPAAKNKLFAQAMRSYSSAHPPAP